jgi:hypothetical protein
MNPTNLQYRVKFQQNFAFQIVISPIIMMGRQAMGTKPEIVLSTTHFCIGSHATEIDQRKCEEQEEVKQKSKE